MPGWEPVNLILQVEYAQKESLRNDYDFFLVSQGRYWLLSLFEQSAIQDVFYPEGQLCCYHQGLGYQEAYGVSHEQEDAKRQANLVPRIQLIQGYSPADKPERHLETNRNEGEQNHEQHTSLLQSHFFWRLSGSAHLVLLLGESCFGAYRARAGLSI